jgi:hypothetical protein
MTVYLVIAMRKSGGLDYGIFSASDNASAWCASLCEETYTQTVTAPFVVDVPEFGNVPKHERQ